MNLNPEESRLYGEAVKLACSAHHGQFRKYTGEPYLFHPMEVAEVLRKYDMPINTVVAGVLHDVVEDTDITSGVIRTLFNDEIADTVIGVTNPATDKNIPRTKRFWTNVAHLQRASEHSQNVKCADIYSNAKNFREGNESFTAQYMAEKIIVLDHLDFADHILVDLARRAVEMNLTGLLAEHRHCINVLYRDK